ncbi:MAG: hypothetical protein ACO3RV_09775, partial [Luteolibacter sp.]
MKMKSLGIVSLLLTAAVHAQIAENYPDATGEIATPGSGPHIDIDSVDVALDETEENLTFTINLAGDPIVTNWGKYMIGIRTGPGGATSGNAWGRPINFSTGITHWIGAWADGEAGGVNLSAFAEGSWSEIKATYSEVEPLALPVITESSFSVTIPTALIGYVAGQSFAFDVYTSGGGGGDGPVEALSASDTSIS